MTNPKQDQEQKILHLKETVLRIANPTIQNAKNCPAAESCAILPDYFTLFPACKSAHHKKLLMKALATFATQECLVKIFEWSFANLPPELLLFIMNEIAMNSAVGAGMVWNILRINFDLLWTVFAPSFKYHQLISRTIARLPVKGQHRASRA